MRTSLAVGLAVLAVLTWAGPAAASHDDLGPGAVVLSDRAGTGGRVIVVFPPDADERKVIAEVESAAAAAGVTLSDVDAVENTDPDTLRVRGTTPLGIRTAFLQRRIPADRIAPWVDVARDGQLFLRLPPGARPAGLPDGGAEIPVTGAEDVTYRLSPWVLMAPLLLIVGAAALPYAGLRWYAARVTRRPGAAEDQLHRLRRVSIAVQFAVPVALILALFVLDAITWPDVLLAEVAPSAQPPAAALSLLGMAGLLVPIVAATAATVLAVLPHDRRLRGTTQSSRAGVAQAVRLLAVMLAPVVVWLVVVTVLPPRSGWVTVGLVVPFLAVVAVAQPFVMNAAMRTRPLDGALRERIIELCRRHGLAIRDARMIDSRGGKVANAAISGVVPPLRYVYLTDHIIEILTADELDAVVAHEIAHGKEHHILIKLVVGLLGIGALFALMMLNDAAVMRWLFDAGMLGVLLGFPVALIVVMLLAHGVVGVALEKRADDRAAEAVGAAPLARALDKLADANKAKRRTGWLWNVLQQHPGMEQRIARLEQRAGPV